MNLWEEWRRWRTGNGGTRGKRFMKQGEERKRRLGLNRERFMQKFRSSKRKLEFNVEFRLFCVKINGSLRMLLRVPGETKEIAWKWQRSKKSEVLVSRVYYFGFL